MRARFADFVLDPTTRELTERGEVRHLSPKAFLILERLVEEAPRALTKEELYKHVWGETFVDEVNLANLVSEIRSALHENAKAPRLLKTIHRYGYAFCGEVTVESARLRRRRSRSHFTLLWRAEEFALAEGANVIGRADDADVVIDSQSVSRRHACIRISGDVVSIEDLESKNGTFLGEQRVHGPAPLRDGDQIRVGKIALEFRVVNRGASTVTQMTR
jgi:DNA-binding winged helix-turn-helix (wHTH) protein